MFARAGIIVILGGLLTAIAVAQPRGPRPWWDSEVAKNANLTDAQQKQLSEIQHDFRPRMREVQQAVKDADAEVAAAFNEEPVDQAKANAAIEKLAQAHAELTRTVSQLDLKLRTVLTAQQWQALNQHMGRGWPGPGGPGGRRRGARSGVATTSTQQK